MQNSFKKLHLVLFSIFVIRMYNYILEYIEKNTNINMLKYLLFRREMYVLFSQNHFSTLNHLACRNYQYLAEYIPTKCAVL